MRFLWNNGYYVKRNLDLLRYEQGRATTDQYTDIDVLGIKIDQQFHQDIVICDCKSGATAKSAERLFWLSGVMKYLKSDKGYFLRHKINQLRYLDLGNQLGIIPISELKLNELEIAYEINSKPFIGSFNKELIFTSQEIFNKLKEEDPIIQEYLRSIYWVDSLQRQITSLILSEFKINKSQQYSLDERVFLQIHILSLLSISILRFSESVMMIPDNEKNKYIMESLIGSKMEGIERKKLLAAFYDFMTNEISKRYKETYPITKSDFIDFIYPHYSKYLVDLVERVCLKPMAAISVPRILDIITYEAILNNNRQARIPINPYFAKTRYLSDIVFDSSFRQNHRFIGILKH
jgi:hypothetical protein